MEQNPPIPNPLRYCLYVRKSSEQSERQALSIDSQIAEMQAVATRDGFLIADTLRESHSAKESGQRPVYNQMVQEIGSGKFNAILTWAPDRLSRNAGDLGSIVDMMDSGKLVEIRTARRQIDLNTMVQENDATFRELQTELELTYTPGYGHAPSSSRGYFYVWRIARDVSKFSTCCTC